LLNTFQRIVEGNQDEDSATISGDETPKATDRGGKRITTSRTLVKSDATTAAGLHPETGKRLSQPASDQQQRGGGIS